MLGRLTTHFLLFTVTHLIIHRNFILLEQSYLMYIHIFRSSSFFDTHFQTPMLEWHIPHLHCLKYPSQSREERVDMRRSLHLSIIMYAMTRVVYSILNNFTKCYNHEPMHPYVVPNSNHDQALQMFKNCNFTQP